MKKYFFKCITATGDKVILITNAKTRKEAKEKIESSYLNFTVESFVKCVDVEKVRERHPH